MSSIYVPNKYYYTSLQKQSFTTHISDRNSIKISKNNIVKMMKTYKISKNNIVKMMKT